VKQIRIGETNTDDDERAQTKVPIWAVLVQTNMLGSEDAERKSCSWSIVDVSFAIRPGSFFVRSFSG
jgi:hypothetical protein